MQHKLPVLFIIIMAVAFASCEKVIDVKLNDAAKKYVIEGVLTDETGGCQVKITQTKNFNEHNDFGGVQGANVTVTDAEGRIVYLTETQPGIYKSSIRGIPGKQYTLDVTIEGKAYSAVSKMPSPVTIDSIYISEMDLISEKEKMVNIVYNDPAGSGNAYRFLLYINGKKMNGLFGRNDELSDGRKTTVTLMDEDVDLKAGDTVKVAMQCIDANVYKYWYSLSQGATGDGESASPANPVTNLSGGALGYFSAHPFRERTVIVK